MNGTHGKPALVQGFLGSHGMSGSKRSSLMMRVQIKVWRVMPVMSITSQFAISEQRAFYDNADIGMEAALAARHFPGQTRATGAAEAGITGAGRVPGKAAPAARKRGNQGIGEMDLAPGGLRNRGNPG